MTALTTPKTWTHYIILMIVLIGLLVAIVMYMSAIEPRARGSAGFEKVLQLYRQGKYADALPLSKNVLAIYEKEYGPTDSRLLNYIYAIAEIELKLDHRPEAEQLYRRALAIKEKNNGKEDPSILGPLNSIAEQVLAQKRLDEADALCRRAVAIRTKIIGTLPPELGRTYRVLAETQVAREQFPAAEESYKESVAIYASVDDPGTRPVMEKLAEVYRKNGKVEEAKRLDEEIFRMKIGTKE